jgi:hypothetical protein
VVFSQAKCPPRALSAAPTRPTALVLICVHSWFLARPIARTLDALSCQRARLG